MPSQISQALLDLLQENGGRLGNLSARKLLREKIGKSISEHAYERSKEQLLSQSLIKRAPGRGGAIELLASENSKTSASPPSPPRDETTDQRIEQLYTSLFYTPGLMPKRNKTTITILCGDDNDKLYCGWDEKRSIFFIQYRPDKNRTDNSDMAETLFNEATKTVQNATI